MDRQGKCLKIGAAVIVGALLLRLLGGGGLDALVRTITSPEAVSVLLFLETGRVIRPDAPTQSEETTDPASTETTAPPETSQPQEPSPPDVAVFSAADAALVEVNNVCGIETDVDRLLQQTLSWDLTGATPTVLIVHSHGTESYAPTPDYTESSPYRTTDNAYNVVSIGDRLVQILEAGGVHAVHDRTLHDSPSYSDSYVNSRESVRRYLDQYPTIQLVLDIHRDAVEDADGNQMKFATTVEGTDTARLMLVVGSDAGGLTHPHWPENMSLAVKLHAQLEKLAPGICRPISFRSQRFNQDLSPGALIVEVGSAGNSHPEALAAAEVLGKAILALAWGTA